MKNKALLVAVIMLLTFFTAGCGDEKQTSATAGNERIVHIGYWGGIPCEAPVLVAKEKGIDKKLGIQVELVKITYDVIPTMLEKGTLDATYECADNIKQMEQGYKMVFTNGVHTGCVQYVAPIDSPINSPADLKGKVIGVESTGGLSMTLLMVELKKLGIDPLNDVTWLTYSADALMPALEKGEIDIYGTWDPTPEIDIQRGKVKLIFSNTKDKPYSDLINCFVAVNSNVVKNEPELSKKINQFFAEGAEFCAGNPHEAAQIMADKKYVNQSVAFTEKLLKDYQWITDPAYGEKSYTWYVNTLKRYSILDKSTDPETFIKATYIPCW
jgi:NitT/TauT family transport system substrate-binding protein